MKESEFNVIWKGACIGILFWICNFILMTIIHLPTLEGTTPTWVTQYMCWLAAWSFMFASVFVLYHCNWKKTKKKR